MRKFLIPIIVIAFGISWVVTTRASYHGGKKAFNASRSSKFLSGEKIKKLLVGKTAVFTHRKSGKTHYLYFKEDGFLEHGIAGRGKTFRKKWWIKGEKTLCRKIGRDNRNFCTKMISINSGEGVNFFLKNNKRFTATLHEGRKMP